MKELGETFKAESETADLWLLNRMRIRQSLLQPYIYPGQERWSPGRLRVWKLEFRELWSNPRVRAAADCGETD